MRIGRPGNKRRVLSSASAAPRAFTEDELPNVMGRVPGWTLSQTDRDAIERTYEFKDFKEAWGFMSSVALCAEQVCLRAAHRSERQLL